MDWMYLWVWEYYCVSFWYLFSITSLEMLHNFHDVLAVFLWLEVEGGYCGPNDILKTQISHVDLSVDDEYDQRLIESSGHNNWIAKI